MHQEENIFPVKVMHLRDSLHNSAGMPYEGAWALPQLIDKNNMFWKLIQASLHQNSEKCKNGLRMLAAKQEKMEGLGWKPPSI